MGRPSATHPEMSARQSAPLHRRSLSVPLAAMKLPFVKMHGIGNDFVLVDNLARKFELGTEEIRLLADRRRGIGCDQLLMVEPPADPRADFRAASTAGTASRSPRCQTAYRTGIGTPSTTRTSSSPT